MKKHKTNGQHERKLIPSRLDDIMLGAMVEVGFLALAALHRRVLGTDLKPPEDMKMDMIRWRHMRLRHRCQNGMCDGRELACSPNGNPLVRRDRLPFCSKCGGRGDYRHRLSELKSTKIVGEWTALFNAELRNQPVPEIEWSE